MRCVLLRSDEEEDFTANFTVELGSRKDCGPSYLRAAERADTVQQINLTGSVEIYRAETARKVIGVQGGKSSQVRSSNVLHVAKSIDLNSSYLHPDPIEALDILKCTKHVNAIRSIGKNPFWVDFWTNHQIQAYKKVCSLYGSSLYVDSTGLKVFPVKRRFGNQERSIFLHMIW